MDGGTQLPGKPADGQHAKRAVRATFWSAINTIIPIIVSLGVFVVTARVLTPADFGVVAFAGGLALVGSSFCPGGFGEAIIQRLEISARQLDSIFWLCLSCGVVVYGLECAAARPLAGLFKMPILAVLIPVIGSRLVADMAGVVPNALLARAMSFHLIALRTAIVSGIAAGITIALLVAGYGIWALVASQLAASYVVTIVSFLAAKWRPRFVFSWDSVKELMGYGIYSTGTQNLTKIFQQNEQVLVGIFLGTSLLGFYNFSKQVSGVFNGVVAGSLGAVAHPMFSGIQDDKARVRRGFMSATFVSSLISFPMFIGLAFVAGRIVPLAFGARWLPAVPLVQIQCALGLIGCIGMLQAGLITSQGKANWWFYYQLLQTVTTALLIVIFARDGLVPMLGSMALKTYIFWFIPVRSSLSLLGMTAKEYFLNFRTPIVGSLGMGLAVQTVNMFGSGLPSIAILAMDILVGSLIYVAITVLIDARRIKSFLALALPRLARSN